MTENEVQTSEVLALSFLLVQSRHLPELQAAGLSEELFSPGGQTLYRCIQEASQHQPLSTQALLDLAPRDLHPLISELKELGNIFYPQSSLAKPMLADIKTWIKEAQC